MTDWIDVSNPPPMAPSEYGWPMSKPVLCFMKSGDMKVATSEQIDDDYPPEWYSLYSERWIITDQITHWCSLPDPPTRCGDD